MFMLYFYINYIKKKERIKEIYKKKYKLLLVYMGR